VILTLLAEAVAQGARFPTACSAIGLSARTVCRWRKDGGLEDQRKGPLTRPAHALCEVERAQIIAIATSPEYRNLSPKQMVPRLADQGVYLASESTVYRVLRANALCAHREPSRPRTHHKPSEYVATGPGQVWTWDITYLRASVRGTFYYLYLVLDLFSRKIVAATVHVEESAELSGPMIERACVQENVDATRLVLHADNGGPMKASTMLATLQRLGVVASFSRPSVSDDNPHVEALFRTLKFRPGYPRKPFESLTQAQQWVEAFVAWYNEQHLHSALRYVSPKDRHERRDAQLLTARHELYQRERNRNPRRWTGDTRNWQPIGAVTLNPAKAKSDTCTMH
jgi:putative transposase